MVPNIKHSGGNRTRTGRPAGGPGYCGPLTPKTSGVEIISLVANIRRGTANPLHEYISQLLYPFPECILLDGLGDICDDGAAKLLGFVGGPLPKVKVCVASRPEAGLQQRLGDRQKFRVRGLTWGDMGLCPINPEGKARW